MAVSRIKRLPKSTIEITVTIPWQEVKDKYEQIFNKAAGEIEIKGFRKGKAPRKLVEKKIDKQKIYEQVIKELIPEVYQQALKEHSLEPIIPPEITLEKAKEGEDWQLEIKIAEKPKVELGDYQKAVAMARQTDKKIWLPGQNEENKEENEKEKLAKQYEAILEALIKEAKVEISDLIIEQEVNRNLSRLIDETKKLGLTLEQYLKSTGKTAKQIREEYRKQAEESLKLEFILQAIADKENITVSEQEIQQAINAVKDDNERNRLRQQTYYLASLLRRQKTLDRLIKPIV